MGRLTTPLVQRGSPAAPRTLKATRFATVSRPGPFQKAPLKGPAPRSPATPRRSRLPSANTNRFLAARSVLAPIAEEDEDREEQDAHARQMRRQLDGWRHDEERRARALEVDEDEDMDGWDDENTLVAMLQDSAPEEDEEEQLMALVDQLKAPMAAQGATLKQYLQDTLLPVYHRVKDAHTTIDDKIDLTFGAGLLTFDEMCKKVERIAIRDEDEIRNAYNSSQRNAEELLAQLRAAYAHRSQLWAVLEQDMDRCATRVTGSLEALSADVEQTIAQLEKKSKAVEKDNSTASNQKMLKGLLEKL